MTTFGYTLSHEEFGPNELVAYAKHAESVGFDFVSASDHFHPWLPQQGESPFVWSTLGAVAEATDDLEVGVGVSAPGYRMGPALYAQAAATVTKMNEDRFFFGVGTGEALNEHVFTDDWPEHDVRLERLEEAIDVIRKLWTGEEISHHGKYFDYENAQLFTVPDSPPPIVFSAFGPQSAQSAAEHGDGLWSVGPQDDIVEAYEDAGGDGPKIAQLTGCYAESEDEAVSTIHEEWPQGSLPGELNQILPTPRHFRQACQMIEESDIRESDTPTTNDADPFIDSLQQAIDAGFDHVYLHQIGPNQEEAIDFFAEEVLPSFR